MRFTAMLFAMLLPAAATAGERLTLATWNLEWMMTPATFQMLAGRCLKRGQRAGGSDRNIPCDIIPDAMWTAEDLARLRGFASKLPIDVIALQETDGPEAAAQVLPDHHFCFTKRRHVQNVGIAIRRGIPYRCNPDYRPLGLPENDVRWGADATLYPGTAREIRLLAVHLKSACSRDPLTSGKPDCRILQRQVPVLEDWIDRRARAGSAFAVLGDFNRRFDDEAGDEPRDALGRIQAMWPEINDGEPAEADLLDAGAEGGAINCRNASGARMPIDHILLGRKLTRRMVPDSFKVWSYERGKRLPDHCLMSIELDLEPQNGL